MLTYYGTHNPFFKFALRIDLADPPGIPVAGRPAQDALRGNLAILGTHSGVIDTIKEMPLLWEWQYPMNRP